MSDLEKVSFFSGTVWYLHQNFTDILNQEEKRHCQTESKFENARLWKVFKIKNCEAIGSRKATVNKWDVYRPYKVVLVGKALENWPNSKIQQTHENAELMFTLYRKLTSQAPLTWQNTNKQTKATNGPLVTSFLEASLQWNTVSVGVRCCQNFNEFFQSCNASSFSKFRKKELRWKWKISVSEKIGNFFEPEKLQFPWRFVNWNSFEEKCTKYAITGDTFPFSHDCFRKPVKYSCVSR